MKNIYFMNERVLFFKNKEQLLKQLHDDVTIKLVSIQVGDNDPKLEFKKYAIQDYINNTDDETQFEIEYPIEADKKYYDLKIKYNE